MRHNSWLLSCMICGAVLLAFGIAEEARGSDRLLHWFLLPVFLCGVLIVEDAVRWLSGELDVFDPTGLIGLFGIHFFLIAPLLHVQCDRWLFEVIPPDDWRPWLGGMATVNLAGLLLYRATREHFRGAETSGHRSNAHWKVRPRRFVFYMASAAMVGVALQLAIYASFGGLVGYMRAVAEKRQAFLGYSYIAMVTDSVPILALMIFALFVWLQRKKPSWVTLFLVLLAFGLLKLLFGGLYGLRTNTVFAMFWAVGIVHFCIRPIPRAFVLGGVVWLVAFMYLYGFYKSAGVEGLAAVFRSAESRAGMEQKIHRPIESTLLGDLGRSDVQAFILYRQMRRHSDYEYGLGRTYIAGLLTILPGPVWRNRPPTVVREGTEALQGRGSYRYRPLGSSEDKYKYVGMSSKVYGLAGEAMLNFGPLGVPAGFVALGVFVGLVSRWLKTWRKRDARRMLLPFLVLVCIELIINDSYIVIGAIHQFLLFPMFVVAIASEHRKVRAPADAAKKCDSGTIGDSLPVQPGATV